MTYIISFKKQHKGHFKARRKDNLLLILVVTEKEKHLKLRNKTFFVSDRAKEVIQGEDLKLLQKYGCWMEGLHSGELKPITEEQKDFILCLKNDKPPQNELFNIYWRYLRRMKIVNTQELNNVKKLMPDDREDWKKIRRSRF